MFYHLNKNRFWLWKALETYGLGIYFIIKSNTFQFQPPRPTLLDIFDDPPIIFILAVVGTFALVYTLWDVNLYYYKPIMTGLLTFVWLFFMIAFVFHDFETGQYLSFESMYAFFVLGSMLHEILFGDD
ncbi:hypothetical protein C5Z25_01500 [Lactobacillus sp. CBA3605]|uniref:hypothetical protein n=1 Tax=Lactobacillus sp. CBA3605 TaxID=2099788 RepID=UPI000CFB8F12|nr:hypothetical protein [Lactobacillus sp. CBA3605]AVK60524.1 hypothetical protein C5Z25_01500 [Lactobacillus sp. CBA3605]